MFKKWSSTVFLVWALAQMGNGQLNDIRRGHYYIDNAERYSTYLNYSEAIAAYEKGIEHFSKALDDTHPLLAVNYTALGRAFLETGDTEKAQLYCTSALNNIRQSFPGGAIEGECLECLGQIAQRKEQYAEALVLYEKVLGINEQLWGKHHRASSQLYLLLGDCYLEQQKYQEAEVYYEKIQQLNQNPEDAEQQQFLGKYHQAMGRCYLAQNRLEEAMEQLNKSLAIYKGSYGEKHPSIAQVHLLLGQVYTQKKAFEQALAQYRLVHPSFQDYSRKNVNIEGYDTCRCNPVLIAGTLGKASSFEVLFEASQQQGDLLQALQHYQQAAQKVQRAAQYFAKDVQHRQQIIHQNEPVFVAGISLSYRLFQLNKDPQYIQKAFDLMNNYKALTLQIERKETSIMQKTIPESVLKEQRSWDTKIADLEFEYYQAESNGTPNVAAKKQALLEARLGQAAFWQAFKRDYWYVEDSVFNKERLHFSSVAARLPPEAALLNYIVDDFKNQLFVLVFTREQAQFIRVDLPADFSKDVRIFHRLLQSTLLTRADKKQRFVEKSQRLYQHLMEPLSGFLTHTKRLIIIRDDVLHLLPFEVLLKTNQLADFEELDYLLLDFEITYHYSAGLWYHSQAQQWEGEAGSLLAFAPVFDKGSSLELPQSAFRCFVQDEVQVPLPHSETEVNTISQILNSRQNTVLLRAEACKQALVEELGKPYQFIHIASHSFANNDNAAFSGLACFLEPKAIQSSCMLYINEIENLDITSDLVVLSSCESGVGQLLKGEGLLGINRSFLYAGVPNTLFSLWKVQDQATAALMIAFYKNIQQNKNYAEALQQAKLSLLQNPETASPLFWASFILIGR